EIVSDRTMVPLRFFFEKLGADVGWDDATRKITVEKGDTLIEMQIDSLTAYVDGAESMLDAAPYIKNDRTMIPLRFLSENLGFSVGWDQDTYSAYIDAVL